MSESAETPIAEHAPDWDNFNLDTGELTAPDESQEQDPAKDTEPDLAVKEESPEEEEQAQPEIYAQTVSISEGSESKEISVGELKDKYTEYRSREAEMDKTQTELLRDMAQVNQILANGGPQTQEQVNQLNGYRENYLAQQHQVMMRAHPEWSDQAKLAQDKADMVEVARRYGKSEQMVGQIQNAMDLQMLHDLTRLTLERERAQAGLKQKIAKPVNPGRKPPARRSSNVNQLGKTLDSFKGKGSEHTDWAELDKLL